MSKRTIPPSLVLSKGTLEQVERASPSPRLPGTPTLAARLPWLLKQSDAASPSSPRQYDYPSITPRQMPPPSPRQTPETEPHTLRPPALQPHTLPPRARSHTASDSPRPKTPRFLPTQQKRVTFAMPSPPTPPPAQHVQPVQPVQVRFATDVDAQKRTPPRSKNVLAAQCKPEVTPYLCLRCNKALALPPPPKTITAFHPKLKISSIDRAKPRCVACDLAGAKQAADDFKAPASHFIDAVVKIEQDLAQIKRYVREGKDVEQMQNCLPEAEKRLANTKKCRAEQQSAVWEEFYGVWGPGNVKIDEPIRKKVVVDKARRDVLRKQARERLKLNKERQMKGIGGGRRRMAAEAKKAATLETIKEEMEEWCEKQ